MKTVDSRPLRESDLTEMAIALRGSVLPLMRRLRRYVQAPLTATQLAALGTIIRHGPMSLSALAGHEQLSRSMVTKVVDSLVDHGFARREKDQRDGRVSLVSPTEAAEAWLQEGRQLRNQWLIDRLRILTPEEQRRIRDALPALGKLADENV